MARKIVLAATVSVLCFASTALGQQWAYKMFQVREHNFGTVARDAKAEFEFPFKNIFVKDVHIAGVRVSCGCTSVWVKNDKRLLKTYETGAIVAHFNTDRFLGSHGATITVTLDRPQYAEVQLQVSGYIRSDLVFNPGSVQFGSVDQGTAVEKEVRVSYAGGSGLRVLGAESSNPHVSATVQSLPDWGQGTYRLRVRLDQTAPAGYVKESVSLLTNDSSGRKIPLLVEGYVAPVISVAPDVLYLGELEPGQKVNKQLVVRGKQPFRITGIRADGQDVAFAATDDAVAKPVHVVPVTFVAGDNPGKVVRTIRIETDLGGSATELKAEGEVSPRIAARPADPAPSAPRDPPAGQAAAAPPSDPPAPEAVPAPPPTESVAPARKTPPPAPQSATAPASETVAPPPPEEREMVIQTPYAEVHIRGVPWAPPTAPYGTPAPGEIPPWGQWGWEWSPGSWAVPAPAPAPAPPPRYYGRRFGRW